MTLKSQCPITPMYRHQITYDDYFTIPMEFNLSANDMQNIKPAQLSKAVMNKLKIDIKN